jgi:hypothetical protein
VILSRLDGVFVARPLIRVDDLDRIFAAELDQFAIVECGAALDHFFREIVEGVYGTAGAVAKADPIRRPCTIETA